MEEVKLSIDELVKLSAVDSQFFSQAFFPKAIRQVSPPAHKLIWSHLENPNARYVNLRCFRGSAKTTLLRLFCAKRIAFGLSRTILFIGASESHAVRSLHWIKSQIERNKLFSQTFSLRPGRKWQESEMEIIHGIDNRPIWLMGAGITGNIRGINFDDYRPDLIIGDDILSDENCATEEQRNKITNLVFGAVKESLTPATEDPNAKLVLLQTPQHGEDVSSIALRDPQWTSHVFSCWTEETIGLPVEEQISSWPQRYPTETLRLEKQSAIARNQVSIFSREMECRIVSAEAAAFRPSWLEYYTEETRPRAAYVVIAIDPVPPPSDLQVAKNFHNKDFEAITVCGRYGGKYYLLDYALNRGHNPNWTIAKVFEFALKYRAAAIVVESIAYQRVLKFILEQEMARRQQFFAVIPYADTRRSKFNRIVSTFNGIAANNLLHCSNQHSEFIIQFTDYPNVDHDDLLDSAAIGFSQLTRPFLELSKDDYFELDDGNIPSIEFGERCP